MTRMSDSRVVARSIRASDKCGNKPWLLIGLTVWLLSVACCQPIAAQEQSVPSATLRDGLVVRVPLPITGEIDGRLRLTIERYLKTLAPAATANDRPVLVLEFDTLRGASGRGSQFERCVSLARFLTSPELARVQTVAYLPGHGEEGGEVQPLAGHALLVAMACETWAFDQTATLAVDQASEASDDLLVRETYRAIAARRQVLPEAVVDALVDRTQGAVLADMTDGTQRYLTLSELESLEAAGEVVRSETVIEANESLVLDAQTLVQRRFVDLLVRGRSDLAGQLQIRRDVMMGDPTLGEEWKPILIRLEGAVDHRRVNWISGSLDEALADGVNLVVVDIDSLGGSLREATRLAQELLELDPLKVRTIAYVGREARGGGALVALACDQLVMQNGAELGGLAEPELNSDDAQLLDTFAERWDGRRVLSSDWVRGLVDNRLTLTRYRNSVSGEESVFSDASYSALDDEQKSAWTSIGLVESQSGISARDAVRFSVARYSVESREELSTLYGLPAEMPQLEPTSTQRWVDQFARFITRPLISSMLLMIGMMLFFNELSTPGLGVPGAMAVICFGLYFWAHYLGGTAHWLELLMFGIGVVFVLMEIFVLPGVGVFGVSGVLMVIASIVLASQTFIFPTTSEDFAKLPSTFGLIVAMVVGGAIPMFILPRYLERIPILRRLVLNPEFDQSFEGVSEREKVADYSHLRGKMGVAMTDLLPGGKVRFGDDDVSVVTDGRMIERGARVVVREVRGNRVVVELSDYANS